MDILGLYQLCSQHLSAFHNTTTNASSLVQSLQTSRDVSRQPEEEMLTSSISSTSPQQSLQSSSWAAENEATQQQQQLQQLLTYNLQLYCEELFNSQQTNRFDHDRYIRESITYYLMGVMGVTICCFGLVGNFLSLIVLTRRTMRTSTYTYLAALGVCDLLFVACSLVMVIKDAKNKPVAAADSQRTLSWAAPLTWGDDKADGWGDASGGGAGVADVYPYLFPYLHPAAFTLQVSSVWLTLAFTVDRFIMICYPFQAQPFCTVARARKVIIALIAGSILFNLPKFFEYKTVTIAHPTTLRENVGNDLTEFGNSRVFKELYHSWFYIMFVFAVPFATLAVLNAFLVHAVRLARRRTDQINSAETKRLDTTVMLIGVVVIFFICQVPALVSRAAWAFVENPKDAFSGLSLYALNEIASFLILLNSSINILPYYFFGRRFRREFLTLFCCSQLKCCLNKRHVGTNSVVVVAAAATRPFSFSLSRRGSSNVDHC